MASPCTSSPELLAGARWQQALRDAVRDIAELAALLDLPVDALRARCTDVTGFGLLVPRGFVAKMRKGDADDPLLRQVLPLSAELTAAAGFTADPLAEHGIARRGLMQKYRGRALLIATGACPVHCRYCFRRAFPYTAQLASRDGFRQALAGLRRDPSIGEVILSGGDPLTLSNRRLAALIDQLDSIASLHSVRIHTRFPVIVPERVDAGLEALLRRTRLKTIVVVHCNHARELGADVAAALEALAGSVDLLLNQAVLLNGVNDRADTLIRLSRRLFECRVLPYYLHLLDRVAGTAHFEVPETRARDLLAALRAELPGYLVPKVVREIPGELSKTPVAP